MTEAERRTALTQLMSWSHQDDTVKVMIRVVCQMRDQPAVGHLARYCPDDFDQLYEECAAIVENEV